jgi:predicted metal-dependent hydrolase
MTRTMTRKNKDFNRGIDLFNRTHFFDAHEVLEDIWRSVPREESRHQPARGHLRLHIQGMVQLAVAFHHESKGNRVGARSVLERAVRNLKGAESSFPALDLDRLRAESTLWLQYLDDSAGTRDGLARPRPKRTPLLGPRTKPKP